MTGMARIPDVLDRFFTAINARDTAHLADVFTDDISYQLLVPYPPLIGKQAVVDALAASIAEADRVLWEIRSWSGSEDLAFVERIDRFWFNGKEAAIECTGVFELRDNAIAAVRDYADLGTWRTRKSAALEH